MAYVIAEPCISVCDGACVSVCPCDCIHGPVEPQSLEGLTPEERAKKVEGQQMFIDPEPCIDCGACEPVCPVNAIFPEKELPERWADYQARNALFFANRR
jgi:ferredoxin